MTDPREPFETDSPVDTTTAATDLDDVRLDVRDVTVKGDAATAAVRTEVTRADGTKLRQDGTRRLVRRDGEWRVVITEE